MALICFFFFPFVWVLSIFSPINLPPTHYFFFPLHLPPPPPPTPSSSSSSSASHQALSFPSLCSLSRSSSPSYDLSTYTRLCACVRVCESHRCCIAGLSSQGRLTAGAREQERSWWMQRCSSSKCVFTVHTVYAWCVKLHERRCGEACR